MHGCIKYTLVHKFYFVCFIFGSLKYSDFCISVVFYLNNFFRLPTGFLKKFKYPTINDYTSVLILMISELPWF